MNRTLRQLLLTSLFVVCLLTSTQVHGEDSSPVTIEATSCPFASTAATTWFPTEITCPVCNTKNIFMVWGSYGSYIYQDPSKYQLIFWPHTSSPSWYSCKKCRLTAFMEDFTKLPAEKIPDLRKLLETVNLPSQKTLSDKESLEHPPYLELSVSDRLVVAEQVYRTLGQTSEEFWAHFYRVMAYHFDSDKKVKEAHDARQKELKIVEGWLTDKSKDGQRKEFLFICGSMHHLMGEDPAATKAFEEAATLKYSNPSIKAEQNSNYDSYLSTIIKESLEMVKKGPSIPPKGVGE
jgi:hypothetical protein